MEKAYVGTVVSDQRIVATVGPMAADGTHHAGRPELALNRHVSVLFGASQGKYPDGNSVLVRGASGSVLVDPALGVRDRSLEVDTVLLTHAHEDHLAGVSAVRFGAIGVHRLDHDALSSIDGLMRLYGVPESEWPAMSELVTGRFHYLGWPDAEALDDGAVIDLGDVTVRLVHAPGHTAGHSVYLVESDGGRVLVTGDIDLTSFGPYYGDAMSSLDDFERTLRTVRDIDADHYVTFHHKGVVTGHEPFATAIDDYWAVIDRRHQHMLQLLASRRTIAELVAEGIVYRPGTRPPVFGDSVEEHTIGRHLDRAIANSEVATDGDHYWTT